ncbi:GNAT family N-acetyltransferase [Nesterenkonia haasae]|uniref:GNAT family N-acetyltransferase n=1 Tax=Nesterenkonia haasae TaxID=2587813 RepID=UPI0012914C2D|nr:GNAT family N-acetyltransferase [Nesterenkonia haasae]NDK32109.1 GNAT family N-acetyltransferase [Nesterenkonia haasae]
MLPNAPSGQPTLTLDSGLTVRPWAEGDDLKLLEVWGDPENPMHHRDRSLLRPSSNEPWSRCIVAEDNGIPLAAATIFRSSLHPDRLSFYAEVAPDYRRRGIAAQLLQILEAEIPNCAVQSLKARCAKGSAAQCFLKDNGFRKVQRSREVIIQPDSLPVPDVENLAIDLEEIATGSVELTQVVTDFYNAVHGWDRAEMTIGRAQQMLLSPESGATGAVVLRSTADENAKPIMAFAISYTPERTDDPADVLLGWDPSLGDGQAEHVVRQLLGLVAARFPVSVEVDDSMVPLKRVTDELAEADEAEVDFEALIYARDAN